MNDVPTTTLPASILIVDDNRENLRLLTSLLTKQGYAVRAAPEGRMALASVQTKLPDLILLDVMMPEMDGYQICTQLKMNARTRNIPVIFISAADQVLDKVKAFSVGGVDYITKPFQMAEMLARVETHLALRAMHKQIEESNTQLARVNDELTREVIERTRAEEKLRQRTVELEARNEELDAFAHTVAHDLKTPLTWVIGYADLLKKEHATLSGEERHDWLGEIAKSGRKMNSIIEELLLLSSVRKMEEIKIQSLDMVSIVDQVLDRLAPMIEEYQAEIILPKTWPRAIGYTLWIEEVWTNYLNNALKYGGQPPRVELGATIQPFTAALVNSEEERGKHVRFWIRDNGSGISPKDQARLFTLFTRLDQVRAKGHGLGLSIVQRIVEKLDGKVGVESEMGQGSTFWFTLREA
ncbi:MAG: hybrid sensor histidine kinase/response regulator [Chloroflexi bacterium]|nr:hybrid sensor histidine kinase/response regulator [Chloroflexota bacterium]